MKFHRIVVAVISSLGLSSLVALEGYKLRSYQDGANVWTICVGHTKGVKAGMTATRAQCDAWLKEDIRYFEYVVNKLVTVPLNQGQYDALVLFAFNVGETRFASSSLLSRLNARDYLGAALEFPRWCMIRDPKTGKMVRSKGLYNRRLAEQQMFIKALYVNH